MNDNQRRFTAIRVAFVPEGPLAREDAWRRAFLRQFGSLLTAPADADLVVFTGGEDPFPFGIARSVKQGKHVVHDQPVLGKDMTISVRATAARKQRLAVHVHPLGRAFAPLADLVGHARAIRLRVLQGVRDRDVEPALIASDAVATVLPATGRRGAPSTVVPIEIADAVFAAVCGWPDDNTLTVSVEPGTEPDTRLLVDFDLGHEIHQLAWSPDSREPLRWRVMTDSTTVERDPTKDLPSMPVNSDACFAAAAADLLHAIRTAEPEADTLDARPDDARDARIAALRDNTLDARAAVELLRELRRAAGGR